MELVEQRVLKSSVCCLGMCLMRERSTERKWGCDSYYRKVHKTGPSSLHRQRGKEAFALHSDTLLPQGLPFNREPCLPIYSSLLEMISAFLSLPWCSMLGNCHFSLLFLQHCSFSLSLPSPISPLFFLFSGMPSWSSPSFSSLWTLLGSPTFFLYLLSFIIFLSFVPPSPGL